MTGIRKLKICDRGLLLMLVVMSASAIQLESTGSSGILWVIIHMILGAIFIALIVWHIFLHFRWCGWGRKLLLSAKPLTKWLTIFGLFLAVSSLVVGTHWYETLSHSGIGGLHGKIGFVFVVIVSVHAWKYRAFIGRRRIKVKSESAH